MPRSVVQRATAEVRAPWLDLYYPAGHIPPQETHQDAITDGFFATFDGPARGIRCAAAIANGAKFLGSMSALASTPVNARSWEPSSVESPSTSARGWLR